MKKRVLTLVVTMAMLLGLLPGFAPQVAQAAAVSGEWTDYATTKEPGQALYNGEPCYMIGTAEELAWFAKKIQNAEEGAEILSKSVVLTADIDLGGHYWTPIFSTVGVQNQYDYGAGNTGNFYGNNHSIINLTIGDSSYVEHTGKSNGITSDGRQYGFIRSATGSVSGIRFVDPVITVSSDAVGTATRQNDVVLIYTTWEGGTVSDIEVANLTADVSLSYSDKFNIVFSGRNVNSFYVNGGSVTVTGLNTDKDRSEDVLLSAGILLKNSVIKSTENSVTDVTGAVYLFGNHAENFYTDLELTADDVKVGAVPVSTKELDAEFIQNVLGSNWTVSGDEVVFVAPQEVQEWNAPRGNWTTYGITKPSYDESSDTYVVKTARELAWFATNVQEAKEGDAILSANLKLAADIDLSGHYWTPILNAAAWRNEGAPGYTGNVDGDFHTISGLTIGDDSWIEAKMTSKFSYHNFGFVATEGTISNLRLETPYVTISQLAVGGNDVYLNSVALLLAKEAVDCEIDNPIVVVHVGGSDKVNLVYASGRIEGLYVKGGTFTAIGGYDSLLSEAVMAYSPNPITNCVVVDTSYKATLKRGIAYLFGENAEYFWTNLEATASNDEERGYRFLDDTSAESIYEKLGGESSGWKLSGDQLVFGSGSKGDINGDGEVNYGDIALINAILSNGDVGYTITEQMRKSADMNGNGTVDILDIAELWALM